MALVVKTASTYRSRRNVYIFLQLLCRVRGFPLFVDKAIDPTHKSQFLFGIFYYVLTVDLITLSA